MNRAKLRPVLRHIVLPALILQLRNQGFFKRPRTSREVQAKLQPIYRFDSIDLALFILQKRKKLRRTSKKSGNRKQVAYVW
jgi:hypothetical protein